MQVSFSITQNNIFITSSGECLQISLRALAEILLRAISGSWIHKTKRGTAPTSTTAYASSAVCLVL